MSVIETTPYGFVWGEVEVTRCLTHPGGNVLLVKTPYRTVEINISPTGRSVRVWRDHKELTEGGDL